MNLSAEEKELFFKVARILQRETTDDSDALLLGYEDSFDGSDIALALYKAAGFIEHPYHLEPEPDPNRPRPSMSELQSLLSRSFATLVNSWEASLVNARFDREFTAGSQWEKIGMSVDVRRPFITPPPST